uniref:Putative mating-type 1-2-1 protein n=1 Tax=Thielaviopsis cerberus TaxID=1580841 RepID=A0A891XJC7_9PEZI|nr:putative mating-type 1-2-1 protein [Thielaviopsis cerberus]
MDPMSGNFSTIGPVLVEAGLGEMVRVDSSAFDFQQHQVMDIAWSLIKIQHSQFSRVAVIDANTLRILNSQSTRTILDAFSTLINDNAIIVHDFLDYNRFFIGAVRDLTSNNACIVSVPGYDTPVLVPSDNQPILNQAPVQQPFGFTPSIEAAHAVDEVIKAKIPRPPNAYIIYRKEHQREVRRLQPGIDNNDVSRILGQKWREESESVKMHYRRISEEYKARFMHVFPFYQYRPRKPAEKRQRRRRAAALPQSLPPSR